MLAFDTELATEPVGELASGSGGQGGGKGGEGEGIGMRR